MGSCASVDHKGSDSAMRYRVSLVGSKAKKFFISSPVKEKSVNGEQQTVPGFGFKSPDFGSKDEVFFDSKAWLDSDCEDFYSVNGEFTPSRGSTPVHPISGATTPKLDSSLFVSIKPDSKPEPSPTGPSPTGRKKLAELFNESIPDAPNTGEETTSINIKPDAYPTQSEQAAKSANGTPSRSVASSVPSSEGTPSRHVKNKKDKMWKTANCCLPSLHNFGFDERRQKMSPEICAV